MAEERAEIEFCGDDIDNEDLEYVDEECEEVFCEDDGSNLDDDSRLFNNIVGAIEEFLMNPEFEEKKDEFLEKHYTVFEDSSENKLEYMDIFQKYTSMVEGLLDAHLKAVVPQFSIDYFTELLTARAAAAGASNEDDDSALSSIIPPDVVDLVSSLVDFETFKEEVLAYKKEKEGSAEGFGICCSAIRVHPDEQEDGEERPDLDESLEIVVLSPKVDPRK
mmetsp:Transcript_12300/g.22026  ORF Transcript_12300/g.22026 Transcript_12300/m.22026 type:complete len:220 (-) Transcript_12300:264-923(-)|eukprot:CAMPEP_0175071776 /NCGR_PEP_ID=MMETSP0052_2-20121109/19452_1 /TAXON_ID=51329 ORGANISM="Polytomella parva, Strain SAG 63-3" /NCGR_SAMPLE_ID=MMETSP0052_2 /ASSEMBLY_ACC=CAM_ASM_000194 /LENGTH=219 /DNA_ID=CAMNT_0016339027 /DNA_START=41 /DNA_END=700 /DNA_ORIENTATION=+